MITWGINALNHDASIAVVSDGILTFWKRSSEYSGIPGDQTLHPRLIKDAYDAGLPTDIVWYEKPWLKKTRQLRAKQWQWAFDLNELPSRYLKSLCVPKYPISYMPHHLSHAAAGFLTSPFEEATVVVLDALGEWQSSSIWKAEGTKLTKLWSRSYPNSLGLFYSAFTKLIGYTPIREEHLLQRDSALGNSNRYYELVSAYFTGIGKLKINLHRGVWDWPYPVKDDQDRCDIAAAVQRVFENQVQFITSMASVYNKSDNLVYMGGCAMNSKCNELIVPHWNGVWSLPIPGDSASAIGAALYHQQRRIVWQGPLAKHINIKYNKV